MSLQERMKTAYERNVKAVALRPSLSSGKEAMTVVTNPDGSCTATDGDDALTIDLGRNYGGNGTTPGAGFYCRAALGSCMTQSYVTRAAVMGIPINQVKIDILSDCDMTAGLALNPDANCGYLDLRLVVEIDSPAPRADLERLAEHVKRYSYMDAIFTEVQPMKHELRIKRSEAA